MINYYHILGLTKTATATEIKSAYRKMAVLYHPDKNPGVSGAEERFKDINQAYQVLSNPQRKAQYDFTLEYAHYALLNNLYTVDKPPPHRRDHFAHYRRYGSNKNRRLEKIGNIWALGFLAFTIIITLIATGLNSYFEQKRQADQLENNIIMFDNARQDYDKGNYQAALLKLKDMSILYSDRFDVYSFKELIYKKILNLADMHFDDENFQSALAYYYMVIENYQYVNVNVFYNVATCHKSLGNYLETINVLEGIANAGYHEIGNHIEIGDIFRIELQDFGQAMEHYKISIDKIEEQYLKFYGEAYPLLLNPHAFPEHHYDAYVGFGIACWYFGLNLKAMNAFDWAIFLRPHQDAAYIAKAECAISMNNMDLACESLTIAVGIGSQDALVRLVQVCN